MRLIGSAVLFTLASGSMSAQVDVSGSFRLSLIDHLDVPKFSAQHRLGAEKTSRALGLRDFKLDASWNAHDRTMLNVTFRPDALRPSTEPVVREYDSRSGSVYEKAPSIQFVDGYEIVHRPAPGAEISLGVYDHVLPRTLAYPEILAFGLSASLPRKFNGGRFSWDLRPASLPTSQGALDRRDGWVLGLVFAQGDRDRGEALTKGSKSYDRANGVSDPYGGGAMVADFYQGRSWVSLAVGLEDRKVDKGRVSRHYFALDYTNKFEVGGFSNLFAIENRYSRERWNTEGIQYAELTQRSHAITNKIETIGKHGLAVGIHNGVSERHNSESVTLKDVYTGFQYDIGWFQVLSNVASARLFTAYETRTHKDSLGTKGAFETDGNLASFARRFAIEVFYEIGGS